MSGVETNETRDLISSDKVEGTSVYDRNGNNLGTISNMMLDKRSGQGPMRCCPSAGFSEWDRDTSFSPRPWSLCRLIMHSIGCSIGWK